MTTILIFILVLLVLVVAHELGHFFAARYFGVYVEEFGIGYPPRAKKLFTWMGTLFTLNWLPFGGFVKIFGEEDEESLKNADKKTSFAHQRLWKRAVIVLAGVVANILMAIILYSAAFSIGFLGSPLDFPHATQISPSKIMVDGVMPNTPASKAGLIQGDSLISFTSTGEEFSPKSSSDVTRYMRAHGNIPVLIEIERQNNKMTLETTPTIGIAGGEPIIGITITDAALIKLPVWRAVGEGFRYTFLMFKTILSSIVGLIVGIFYGHTSGFSQLSGPVGIAKFAGSALGFGFGSFLSFVALISINLAVVNLFPFPALDGGRLILEFFAREGKSKIPKKAISILNQFSFLLLILIMLFVTYHDIVKVFFS